MAQLSPLQASSSVYSSQPLPGLASISYAQPGAGIVADTFQRQDKTSLGQPHSVTLANGMQAALQQAPGKQQSSITLIIPNPVYNPTVAAMFRLTLMDGLTRSKPLVQEALLKGIVVNADALNEAQTTIDLSGPVGSEPQMLGVAQQLLQAAVDPQAWDLERYAHHRDILIKSLTDIAQDENVPLAIAMQKALYGASHPFTQSPEESIATLQRLQPAEVLTAYRAILSQPDMLKVAMVSPQGLDKQQAILNQGLGQLRLTAETAADSNAQLKQSQELLEQLRHAPPTRRRVVVSKPSLERTQVMMGWRAPALTDPDFIPFSVLVSMLGGMSGEWFQVFRLQNGLVYSTQREYASNPYTPYYQVRAEVDHDKVPQALESFKTVIDHLRNTPTDPGLLAMTKQRMVRELREDTQSSDTILAGYLAPHFAYDRPLVHPQDLERQIAAVTPNDIRRVAERVFGANDATVIGLAAPPGVLEGYGLAASTL